MLPFELPRVLTPEIARRVGISRSRMRTETRRGNWRTFARGAVLTRPDEPTRADWADLGIALAGPGAALSGWDGVRAHGLGDPTPPSDEVLILSRHSANRVIGKVRIRETARPYEVAITPLMSRYPLTPIVAVARAVADAACQYRLPGPVRALVTSAIQRGRCGVQDLVAELEDGPRQHSAHLRDAVESTLDGARSAAEAVTARRLTVAKLPPFELNVPVVRHGVVLFVVDVLWRALRAVLEVDSREWHLGEEQWKASMRRHNQLSAFGLTVIHYPPSVLAARSTAWTEEIRGWLESRADELGIPVPDGYGAVRAGAGGPDPLLVR